jgi:hypothetical protein
MRRRLETAGCHMPTSSQDAEYVKLSDSLSGGSIICCTNKAPDQESFRKSENVLAGIVCTPANSKVSRCSYLCKCVCKTSLQSHELINTTFCVFTFLFVGKCTCVMSVIRHTSSVTLITPHIVGECVCHELVVDVSKRKLWGGACQSLTLSHVCYLLFIMRAIMLLDAAFTRDDLLCGSKEVTTYVFLGC